MPPHPCAVPQSSLAAALRARAEEQEAALAARVASEAQTEESCMARRGAGRRVLGALVRVATYGVVGAAAAATAARRA